MKQAQIKQLLPSVFQRTAEPGTPLVAILDIMQMLHDPPESIIDDLDSIFDPHRTPDRFVPYLASWVDLGVLLETQGSRESSSTVSISTGLGRLRELIAMAAQLSEWRGTRKGLQLFLQAATGSANFEIDERVMGNDGTIKSFHIRIKAPPALMEHRPLIERIVELEKPAYVTYELEFEA